MLISLAGNHIEGVREGYGMFTFASGAEYRGEYKNNKREGKGVYKDANGMQTARMWIDGKPTDKVLSDAETEEVEKAAADAKAIALSKAVASETNKTEAAADNEHKEETTNAVASETTNGEASATATAVN